MDITRRQFIGMLGAATAIGSTAAFGFVGDTEFRDFDPDAMYDFHDANGLKVIDNKRFGREWSEALEDSLRKLEMRGQLESVFGGVSKREMRFISQDCGKDISITEAWLREFWRRHNVI